MIGLTLAGRHVGVDQRTDRIVPGWNLLVGVPFLLVSLDVQVDLVPKLVFLVARPRPAFRRSALALRSAAFRAAFFPVATSSATPPPTTTRALSFLAFASRGTARRFQSIFGFHVHVFVERFVVEFFAHFDMVETLVAEFSPLGTTRPLAAPATLGAGCPFAASLALLATSATPATSPPTSSARLFPFLARRTAADGRLSFVFAQAQISRFFDRVIDFVLVLIQFHVAATRPCGKRLRLVPFAPRRTRRRLTESRRSAGAFAASRFAPARSFALASAPPFAARPFTALGSFATLSAIAPRPAFAALAPFFARSTLASFAAFGSLAARQPLAAAETFFPTFPAASAAAFSCAFASSPFAPRGCTAAAFSAGCFGLLGRRQFAAETAKGAAPRRGRFTHRLAIGGSLAVRRLDGWRLGGRLRGGLFFLLRLRRRRQA